jgi:hypothetical protein
MNYFGALLEHPIYLAVLAAAFVGLGVLNYWYYQSRKHMSREERKRHDEEMRHPGLW